MKWDRRWEPDWDGDQAQLAALLRRVFPGTGIGEHAWVGARPELRVAAYADNEPVAHGAVLRRVVHIGDVEQPVGEAGLIGVHPGMRRAGVGRALLDQLGVALRDLGVPYGFLTCHARHAYFAMGSGWRPLPQETGDPGTPSTSVAMILPVANTPLHWPPGPVVARDGPAL